MTRIVLLGTAGADRLVVRKKDEHLAFDIYGLEGDDTLGGGARADLILAAAGHDSISGNAGDDTLDGGAGNDTMRGGSGADSMFGGTGRDTLSGGDGNDTLDGGANSDRLEGDNGDDSLAGEDGNDALNGGNGADTLRGGNGDDRLSGGNGDDSLRGGAGEDSVTGGAGHDSLVGGSGDDELAGNAGNDSIAGGEGIDVAEFRGKLNDYRITLLEDGALEVRGIRGSGRGDGTDIIREVERLRFKDAEISGDTTTPVVEIAGFANDTGVLGDGITADGCPLISGTATPGAEVELYRDGVAVGRVTADSNGQWSIEDDAGLADGAYAYTARAFGNFGVASALAGPLGVTIDTTAPDAPSFRLANSSDTGVLGDAETALRFVNLTGVAEAGATVELLGSGLTAIADAEGDFLFANIDLAAGINEFELRITDAAGNLTEASFEIERLADAVQDPVLAWNDITLEAIRINGSVTAIATRVLAMTSAAIIDTLASIEDSQHLLVALEAPNDIPAGAAIAAAAHKVLSYLYPAQAATFDARLAIDLGLYEAGPARDAAVAFGEQVADAVIAIRAGDGWNASVSYPGGTDPGQWRPTPPAFASAHQPQWGDVTPWTMDAGDQFRPDGPPALDSEQYAIDFDEVKRLGRVDSTERTEEQTEIARYWRDQAGTYTPAGRWAQIAGEVLADGGYSTATNAWVLGVLNFVQADGAIAAWDAKYHYGSWRPITAIREADLDGNPLTSPDLTWTSLLTTPNHPDYLSGHATCSSSSAYALTMMLGEIAFSNESVGLPGVTRHFDNFVDAALEAGKSRIYGGIHFDFANRDGIETGRLIAEHGVARLESAADSYAPVVLLATGGAVVAAAPVLDGFAFDNRLGLGVVQASLNGGVAVEITVGADGRFEADLAALFGALADGAHELALSAEDAAGNVSAPVVYAFTIDSLFGG